MDTYEKRMKIQFKEMASKMDSGEKKELNFENALEERKGITLGSGMPDLMKADLKRIEEFSDSKLLINKGKIGGRK